MDSPAVKSARGHVATFEEFAGRERKRIEEDGPFPVSEEHSRMMLAHYEERLRVARAELTSAEKAQNESSRQG